MYPPLRKHVSSQILKIHIFTHLTPFLLGVAVIIFGGGMFSSSETSGV